MLIALTVLLAAAPASAAEGTVDTTRLKPRARVRSEWAARYQDSRHGPEVTERFSRAVNVGADGALEISNVSGDIVVTGGSGSQVRIEAVKRARARDEGDAKALLNELRIEVTEMTNRVEVRTVYPRNRRNYSASVDYTIAMPSGGSATVKTVSGDLRVTNVRGELSAETVSGDVMASGSTRLVLVKSVSGDVEVSDASTEGTATVETVSGDVTARGLKARALQLGSVSGDVLVADVACERATLKTVSGNLEYGGRLARNGRYEMTAHSGNIRLSLAGDTGFELEATTFNGDVRSDIPLTLHSTPGEGRGRRNRSIRGSYGDASAIVNLQSFSGDIVVTKR
jgi:DUF4097 and DUF4098 domain-containing protein YvlB